MHNKITIPESCKLTDALLHQVPDCVLVLPVKPVQGSFLQHKDAGRLACGLLVSAVDLPHEAGSRTGHVGGHLVLPGDGVAGQHAGDDVPGAVHCVGDGVREITGQGGLQLAQHVHCHDYLYCTVML